QISIPNLLSQLITFGIYLSTTEKAMPEVMISNSEDIKNWLLFLLIILIFNIEFLIKSLSNSVF
ncbi:MAG: hypothetical protein KAQ71_12650, partial [Desulfobulbaceae bacterium]|nr:hypothetical protein [Desulfobulbaceae bacterium]